MTPLSPATRSQHVELILAQPRGFCAGVERAIDIVERAVALYGPPIYVRHEIVHNRWVVEDLKRKGVIFVDELSEIPDGAITIFSAHGVSEKVEDEARLRVLPVIDATCPLVTKVHREGQRYETEGREVILIGHPGHPEVEGTSGRLRQQVHIVASPEEAARLKVKNPDNLAYITQTTLSVDDTRTIIETLKERFPSIAGPDTRDICYATQNRQNAVKALASECDLVLVIGAANSSNSNRLRDLAQEYGIDAYLINDYRDIEFTWLMGKKRIGITAGASAPERLVEATVSHLQHHFKHARLRTLDGLQENIRFKLPREVLEPVYNENPSKDSAVSVGY